MIVPTRMCRVPHPLNRLATHLHQLPADTRLVHQATLRIARAGES